jgi:glycerophosphoryl diester phosphodiesterase
VRVPLPPEFLTLPLTHRGLHDRKARRPELGMSAFGAALAAGYGIELDVLLSSDGQAMVFHDPTLDRMTEQTGLLAGRSAAELGRIALRDSDDRIPTLPQVLELVAGQVPVLIEIKDATHTFDRSDGQIEAAVARAVAGYRGPVAVMSYNPVFMLGLADLAPLVPRGLTTESFAAAEYAYLPGDLRERLGAISEFDAVGASFISHGFRDLGLARVAELKRQGAAILCWTIRSPADEALARQVADNITFEGYAAPFPA